MKAFFELLLLIIVVLAAGYWLGSNLAADSRAMSVKSSLENNELAPCPRAHICVNSDSPSTDDHFIVPIADPGGTRWAKLVTIVDNMDGAELVLSTDDYAYFTFTTKFLHFIDDVEFHNRPMDQVIAVRSASRVGKIDLGNNRRRIEDIRIELGL